MKKQVYKVIPSLKSDEEAEKFVATADLLEYDLSQFTPVRFEFESKNVAVNMQLPQLLLTDLSTKKLRMGAKTGNP